MTDRPFRPVIDAAELRHQMRQLFEGDLRQVWIVRQIDHETLYHGTVADQPYLVQPEAVHRVLSAYRADPRHTQQDVQFWAQFVRNGAGPGPDGPFERIDTAYAPEAEPALVDAIGRMDELGDEIDGVMTMAEADQLLAALEGHMR